MIKCIVIFKTEVFSIGRSLYVTDHVARTCTNILAIDPEGS